jgi:hypothetical protein
MDLAGTVVVREDLFQSDPVLIEKCLRGALKGLLHIRQRRSSTIPILAKLMKIREDVADKVYDMVLPGLTPDGNLNQENQRKVLDFVLKIQGIKEPIAPEKVFDFSPVRKMRVELDQQKWRPNIP